jgi:hypothetical protein
MAYGCSNIAYASSVVPNLVDHRFFAFVVGDTWTEAGESQGAIGLRRSIIGGDFLFLNFSPGVPAARQRKRHLTVNTACQRWSLLDYTHVD